MVTIDTLMAAGEAGAAVGAEVGARISKKAIPFRVTTMTIAIVSIVNSSSTVAAKDLVCTGTNPMTTMTFGLIQCTKKDTDRQKGKRVTVSS